MDIYSVVGILALSLAGLVVVIWTIRETLRLNEVQDGLEKWAEAEREAEQLKHEVCEAPRPEMDLPSVIAHLEEDQEVVDQMMAVMDSLKESAQLDESTAKAAEKVRKEIAASKPKAKKPKAKVKPKKSNAAKAKKARSKGM